MLTNAQINHLVNRFMQLATQQQLTAAEEEEFTSVIQQLGFTNQDLRDLAAHARRRAIYLQNTQ